MPADLMAFFTEAAAPSPPDLTQRMLKFMSFKPQKAGGARDWRVECAALLTMSRRQALQVAAAGAPPHRACGGRTLAELVFRFMQVAAQNFKPKSKLSWWPWVALACGISGISVLHLTEAVSQLDKQWVERLRVVFQLATNKFNLPKALPQPSVPTALAGPMSPVKRKDTTELGDAASEIHRIMGAPMTSWCVLGLERRAGAAEVRSRYRALALLTHPDKCGLEQATAAFRRVQEAYEAWRRRHRSQRR